MNLCHPTDHRLLQWLRFRYLPDVITLILGVTITLPLWVVDRPPLQDLPQHVAAVRVLASYAEQAYRFTEYFELSLGKTQYLSVYLAAATLAKLLGPLVGTKLVLSASLAATPYCLLQLMRALDYSPWLALLALPLVFNVHVALGFLNFVAAIPLLFLGLALAVRLRRKDNYCCSIALAALLLLTFYTHVVPFAVLLFGVVALTRAERKAILCRLGLLTPSMIGVLVWLTTSPAGHIVVALGSKGENRTSALPSYQSTGIALRGIADWLTDIETGEGDDLRLVVWAIMMLTLLVSASLAEQGHEAAKAHRRQLYARGIVALMCPLTLTCYFTLPAASDFIWPICQRFVVIAALFLIPLVARAQALVRAMGVTTSIVLALCATAETIGIYRDAHAQAYQGFDAILTQIPRGSRVAALVFERNLEGLRFSPMMHAAGWVQAERGGLVMFSFAEFPPSPFTYRESNRPPKVAPRWEWVPERVNPDRDLTWYDFVLVRGTEGSLDGSRWFLRVSTAGHWSLWRKVSRMGG